jgi:hypothetical protein
MTLRTVVVCLLLLFVLSVSLAFAQAPVYFDPQDAFIGDDACDSVFCVEVYIGQCDSIKGYSFGITYDTTYLTLGSVSESGFLGSELFFWQEVLSPPFATVTVDNGATGDPVPGPGHLFTLCFDPPFSCTPGEGPMPLVFSSGLVRDQLNHPIAISTVDGTVTVRCGITPVEKSLWGGIKNLYK